MDSSIGESIWYLLLVFVLILINGFFVAAEFSLVKVRQTRLKQLASEGKRRSVYAREVSEHLDVYMTACQLGISLSSLALGFVGAQAIARLIVEPLLGSLQLHSSWYSLGSFGLAFGLVALFHIILGEMVPKYLAIQKAESTTLWVAAPLHFFARLTYPLVWVLNRTSKLFLRALRIQPPSQLDLAHTEEEIRLLVNESHKSGHIDHTELALVDNVFDFSERLAREIMIPRIDMVCLYDDNSFQENLEIIRESRHSRFPVAHEDKDKIIGFVHASDFYLGALTHGEVNLQDYLRPVLTVPESMEISQVLRMMQKRRSQMAIVIDEYGGTAGLLTMEDILEEIVGEIQDEFDEVERPEIESTNNVLSVSGKTLLSELNSYIPIDLHSDEVDTIGGWLYSQLNEDIAEGKSVTYKNYLFTITELDSHRINRIGITLIEQDDEANDEKMVMQA